MWKEYKDLMVAIVVSLALTFWYNFSHYKLLTNQLGTLYSNHKKELGFETLDLLMLSDLLINLMILICVYLFAVWVRKIGIWLIFITTLAILNPMHALENLTLISKVDNLAIRFYLASNSGAVVLLELFIIYWVLKKSTILIMKIRKEVR